jgi:hypothetical protein
MNYLIDSNILIYAKMDSMPEHASVADWLERAISDRSTTISVCETSLLSFLRVATNRRVFNPTLPVEEARKFIDSFLSCPNVNLIATSPAHYREVTNLMETHDLQGNLVMDIHLAVLAQSIGATVVTRDADFVKIPYLKTLNPVKDL